MRRSIRRFIEEFSIEHPWLIIAMVTAITVFFAVQLPGIKIDTDPENMLRADEAARLFDHEVKDEFAISDFIAVGVVSEDGAFNSRLLGDVHAIVEEISEIEGVVADDILSPSTVDDIRQDSEGVLTVSTLMEDPPENDAEAEFILERIKSNPVLRGKLASDDGKAIALFIPIESKNESHRIAGEIREIIARHSSGEDYFIAGLPVAEDSFGAEMFRQMALSAPMAGLIIFLLLLLFFRNWKVVISPMIVAVVSVIWTIGLLVMTGNTVHIMSSMIPIFLIPIAVLNSIHIISEFHDEFQRYKHKKTTIRNTILKLFTPMLFTSLTTVVGFASLALTPIPPVRVFGIFVAFGIAVAWLLSITFNPAFAVLIPTRSLRNFGKTDEAHGPLSRALHVLRDFNRKHYRAVLAGSAVIVVISAIGLSRIIVNDNPVKWFKSNHPLRVADAALNEHLAGTYMNYFVIDGGEEDAMKDPETLRYIERLQRHLEKSPFVGAATGLPDIVKKVSFELFGGDPGKFAIPDSRREVAQDLFLFEISGGDPGDLFKFVSEDYSKVNLWVQLNQGDNSSVRSVVESAKDFMEKNPPPASLDAAWAGMPYINIIWQEKMVKGMLAALLSSFAAVFVMMVFLFRSPLLGLISMLPLSITIMAVYGAIGFVGKPYDMPIAVLSSLTLGLSIDFAIHFLKRAKNIHNETGDFEKTYSEMFEGPGRAISRNVLVIAIGFVPMFFSTLVPYITVGSFFFAIMMISGAVTMLLLPSIFIVLRKKMFPRGPGRPAGEDIRTEVESQLKEEVMKVGMIVAAAAVMLVSLPGFARSATPDAEALMKEAHLAMFYAGDDGISEVEMKIVNSKGKERVREFTMMRLDIEDGGRQMYYTYFRKPHDVSRLTFLVHKLPEENDSRWLYIPSVDLIKRISSDDKSSSFVGSDFTYEDVSGRHWTEDTHTFLREDEYDGRAVYVVESKPKKKYKGFTRKVTFIDKENHLVLREEYFKKGDTPERVFTAETVEVIDGIPTPTFRKMENIKKNQYTTVEFSGIRYNVGLDESIFTERYLKNPPREYIR